MKRPQKKFLLVGNPNTGKSTLFNALTGLKQKVSNYPGVTVEKKVGHFTENDLHVELTDLPGTYSLIPHSADETITVQQILYHAADCDGIVVVVDSTNLERNLYFVTQMIDCGFPIILVLNMSDELAKQNRSIDIAGLQKNLGIPVFLTSAQRKENIPQLRAILAQNVSLPPHLIGEKIQLPADAISATLPLTEYLTQQRRRGALAEALRVISREDALEEYSVAERAELSRLRQDAQKTLQQQNIDWRALESELRFTWIKRIVKQVLRQKTAPKISLTEHLDRIALHRVFAPFVFFGIIILIFQALFSWSSYPMELIDNGVGWLANIVAAQLPDGLLKSFVVDGIFAGVGGVLIFVPQIALLFFFICLLEDSGYLSRASFVMDRVMRKLGLNGKAFIPLISSFACAIPGIMATRTIESKRDRLITIMIAPLMSCSARLPVYTLLIAACIPTIKIFGLISVQALVMWGLYFAGVVVALGVSWLLKKTILSSPSLPTLIELPPYRIPQLSSLVKKTFERAWLFVKNAGTVILTLSLFLWFLMSFPQAPQSTQTQQTQLEYSFAGRLGKTIEPVIAPLGFDWKIGVGLISAFAAREVFVSTMAIMYHLDDVDENSSTLLESIREDKRADGSKIFTALTGISLLLFVLFSCQCMSTIAIVKRETNSWRWPAFMLLYMTVLAYVISFVVYQIGTWLSS